MNRRRALTGISALAAWIMLGGQTPYRQWKRDGYGDLLLYTNNDDPGASWTGGLLAGQLLKMLPASGARVAVESTAEGLASAIAQRHGELAIVAYALALKMYRGDAPFQKFGPIDLRVLVENYKYQLVCLADFPRDKAFLVTEALMQDPEPQKLNVPDRPAATQSRDSIPTHPGALAFRKGEQLDAK